MGAGFAREQFRVTSSYLRMMDYNWIWRLMTDFLSRVRIPLHAQLMKDREIITF